MNEFEKIKIDVNNCEYHDFTKLKGCIKDICIELSKRVEDGKL